MEFRSHRLENGLEIVAECNDQAHSAAVGFFVKTGSRDETDEVAGVSHFLEHMTFKGTATRNAEDVNERTTRSARHDSECCLGEVVVLSLDVLKNGNDGTVFSIVSIDDPDHVFRLHRNAHVAPLSSANPAMRDLVVLVAVPDASF